MTESGETEVGEINLIAIFAAAYGPVLRVASVAGQRTGMDIPNAWNELIGKEKDGLQGELVMAKVKKIFQVRPEEVHCQDLPSVCGIVAAEKRNTNTTNQGKVDIELMLEWAMLGFDILDLDSNLFAFPFFTVLPSNYAGSEVDGLTSPLETEFFSRRGHQMARIHDLGGGRTVL
jgi:hypothetical protein